MEIRIDKEQIDDIFATAETQEDYIIALYKLVFPDWDDIEKIDGWPRAGKELREYAAEKAHAWDKEHCPEVLPGGAWILNYGWSAAKEAETLGLWHVTTQGVKVIYKEKASA